MTGSAAGAVTGEAPGGDDEHGTTGGWVRIRVEGLVQGVGYRPFVCGLAGAHGIAGCVGNDPEGCSSRRGGSRRPCARSWPR